jgi:hypothetical protein
MDLDANEYEKEPLKGFQEQSLGARHQQVGALIVAIVVKLATELL